MTLLHDEAGFLLLLMPFSSSDIFLMPFPLFMDTLQRLNIYFIRWHCFLFDRCLFWDYNYTSVDGFFIFSHRYIIFVNRYFFIFIAFITDIFSAITVTFFTSLFIDFPMSIFLFSEYLHIFAEIPQMSFHLLYESLSQIFPSLKPFTHHYGYMPSLFSFFWRERYFHSIHDFHCCYFHTFHLILNARNGFAFLLWYIYWYFALDIIWLFFPEKRRGSSSI